MSRPEGQVEDRMGVFEWRMPDEDTMEVFINQATINQVSYNGGATLHRKDGRLIFLFRDAFLHRIGDTLNDPTRNAFAAFRNKVVEIITAADTEETRRLALVARLHAETNAASSEIITLREEIEDQEDIIEAIKGELAAMGEDVS